MNPPLAAARTIHLRDFDPDQLLEVVRGARFEHYILGPTKCSVRLDRWTCGNFNVDIGNYNFPVRAIGAFPRNKFCVGYMRKLRQPTRVNGFLADSGTIELYPLNSELNYHAGAHAEWVAVEFDEAGLQGAARERLGCELDLAWTHVTSFNVPPDCRATLDRMVRRLWGYGASGVAMIKPILGIIAELLHDMRHGTPGFRQGKWLRRQAMLDQADRFLRDHLSEPFDLSVLASAVGTTPRTLQRNFLQTYGVTPRQWARCHALHRVRKRLLTEDLRKFTVESIARECGFRHMGRFSGYYRELFGESPSAAVPPRD